MMSDRDPIQIKIRGIKKAFGAHQVLKGVDLDVERGKIDRKSVV